MWQWVGKFEPISFTISSVLFFPCLVKVSTIEFFQPPSHFHRSMNMSALHLSLQSRRNSDITNANSYHTVFFMTSLLCRHFFFIWLPTTVSACLHLDFCVLMNLIAHPDEATQSKDDIDLIASDTRPVKLVLLNYMRSRSLCPYTLINLL